MWCFMPIKFLQPIMMYLCEHGAPRPNSMVLKLVPQCIYVLWAPKIFNTPLSIEKDCFPCEFSNYNHKHYKILNKTFIKLCHSIQYLNLQWILWYNMFTIACIFFELGGLPSFETINLIITLENTMKVHFSWFKLIMYSLHFRKHNLNFYKWVYVSLYTMK